MVLLIVDTQTMIMNEALYEFQLLESRINIDSASQKAWCRGGVCSSR